MLCGALAVGATLAVHIGFSYQRHLETGWLRDAYPRYYLPLLPVFAAACVLVIEELRTPRARAGLAGALILLALAYGGLHRLAAVV